MLKKLLCIMVLTSCVHQEPTTLNNQEFDDRVEQLDYRVKQLESMNLSHSFFIDTDRCFIDYLMCKTKDNNKKCWGVHEQCVISVYHMYEQLKKK